MKSPDPAPRRPLRQTGFRSHLQRAFQLNVASDVTLASSGPRSVQPTVDYLPLFTASDPPDLMINLEVVYLICLPGSQSICCLHILLYNRRSA